MSNEKVKDSGKRIAMVLAHSFPNDIRVEKESRALIAAGYDIELLSAPKVGAKKMEIWENIKVHRVDVPTPGTLMSKVHNTYALATFVHPSWKQAIREYAIQTRPSAIHVHDLPLANTAIKAVRGLGIPVVVDLHENYPAAIQEWNQHAVGLQGFIFRTFGGYRRWIRHESKVCSKVDGVIVVIEEMKERLKKDHPELPEQKLKVISNTEDDRFAKGSDIDLKIVENYSRFFTLLYIGGFGSERGLDTAILGAAKLKGKIPNLKLLLVGRGGAEASRKLDEYLDSLVTQNDLAGIVEILGWQPSSKVLSFMKAASIGLVPHHSNEHTDNTIPHKLFQYMMVGLPVVVSSCRPLKRVTELAAAGEVFEAGDPDSFAEKVLRLFHDEKLRIQKGRNGENAATEGDLSWKSTGRDLVQFYEGLLSREK